MSGLKNASRESNVDAFQVGIRLGKQARRRNGSFLPGAHQACSHGRERAARGRFLQKDPVPQTHMQRPGQWPCAFNIGVHGTPAHGPVQPLLQPDMKGTQVTSGDSGAPQVGSVGLPGVSTGYGHLSAVRRTGHSWVTEHFANQLISPHVEESGCRAPGRELLVPEPRV